MSVLARTDIESRSRQLEMNGTWHERYCPTPPHPSPPECRAQSPGVFNLRWTGRDMNVAEHRVQESSTRDERDVTWTLLPHPTPPIPPWMQSTESRRWTGRDMKVIAPPHPTHPPLNAEHRVQESSTWDEQDVTWTFLLHLTPPIPPWMQSIEPESEVQVNQNPSRKWTLRVASEPEVQVNQNPSRKWTLCLSGCPEWCWKIAGIPKLPYP